MSDPKEEKPSEADPEDLSTLLDETLADFDKQRDEKLEKEALEKQAAVSTPNVLPAAAADQWTEDFIKQVTKQFEDNMRSLLTEKNTANAGQQPDLGAFNMESLLQGMMSGSDSSAASAGENEVLNPMFQGIVQQLLSKDLIYPPLKHVSNQFPDWLTKNGPGLSQEENTRRLKQAEVVGKICLVYENASLSASEQQEKVLPLMETLQELGQPPEELLPEGEAAQFPGLGSQGVDPNCSMM